MTDQAGRFVDGQQVFVFGDDVEQVWNQAVECNNRREAVEGLPPASGVACYPATPKGTASLTGIAASAIIRAASACERTSVLSTMW